MPYYDPMSLLDSQSSLYSLFGLKQPVFEIDPSHMDLHHDRFKLLAFAKEHDAIFKICQEDSGGPDDDMFEFKMMYEIYKHISSHKTHFLHK